MIPALLYRLWASPTILLGIEVLTVMSGLIPLYRLAGRRLGDPQLAVGVCVLYLLFAAVQFNALRDFRPDFVEAEQSKRAGDHQDSGGRHPLAAWRLRFDLSRAL